MQDHYEVLGVKRDATYLEIKEAYRFKARINHPDRGGSAEFMAAINVAWEVLGDEESRRHYDNTGEDKAFNVAGAAQDQLAMLIDQYLTHPQDCDVDLVEKFRGCVNESLRAAQGEMTKAKRVVEKCERTMARLQGPLVQAMAANRIAAMDKAIRGLERNVLVFQTMLTLLAEYKDTDVPVQNIQTAAQYQRRLISDWFSATRGGD